MKQFFGLVLVGVGCVVWCYVAFWLMLVGGILDVVSAVRAVTLVKMNIAIGLLKIVFSGFVGGFCGYLIIIPGLALMACEKGD